MKIVTVLAIGVGFIVAPFVIFPKWHDVQLARLQGEVGALPSSANSKFVARHGASGNFGNGDHLDFWAVELRSFSGSRTTLQKMYRGLRVPVPNSDDDGFSDVKNGTQPVEIEFLPSPLPPNYKLTVGQFEQWNLSRFAGRRGLYVVETANFGQVNAATIFDWRAL